MEEQKIYIFASYSGDLGRWAYYINGRINAGKSKGTTKDQMHLMGVLQVLRDDNIEEEYIQLYITDKRTYKRLIGEYEKNSGIITDYFNEIEWSMGNKKITYFYIDEKECIKLPFYKEIQDIFQGI